MHIQEMAQEQCYELLAGTRLGRLACTRDHQPYVVPIFFTFSKPYLYGFTTLGQKVEWMRINPRVCVEVDEVVSSQEWVSVVVFGHYEELPDTPEWSSQRFCAHQLLQTEAQWWLPGVAVPRPFTPIFYRIVIENVTGRRASLDA